MNESSETNLNSPTLAAGLRWLFETEQPDDALLQHHGVVLAGEANRRFAFIPRGWDGHAVVVVDVTNIEWKPDGQGYDVPANPLDPDELSQLTAALASQGIEVINTWNGHPATTGSLALKRPAHPSLIAAVQRYLDGCPEHPREGVFCKCGWYRRGRDKVVEPVAEPECNGLCLTTADVGVAVAGNPVAYPHPACPQHSGPDPLPDDDGTCGDCATGKCHGTDPEDCGCARHDASVEADRA